MKNVLQQEQEMFEKEVGFADQEFYNEIFASSNQRVHIATLEGVVEWAKNVDKKQPHELEAIPEEDKGKLTDAMLRNGLKVMQNQQDMEFRMGYNQAIEDLINELQTQILV